METPELDPRRQITYIALAALSTAPGVLVRLTGVHPDPVLAAFLYGMAIVGAAFILAWAAEVIQLDIGAGLALAMLALIAVLPEYAVDFVFTSKAGQEFAGHRPGLHLRAARLGQHDRGQSTPHRVRVADGDPYRHLAGQEEAGHSR